ncbi:type II toxin-antitoxin system Phd/YefM family antitoxin [Patescibacteria group bacterium]|nr:type II toxin-antitoxin system Phd/YefM family antitoxin [Patescibacteria group bacterium]
MSTKTTISISEARKRIFQLTKEVQRPSVFYTLTDNGRPKAVIMSAQDFESWQETLEVMNIFPNWKKNIEKAREDYKKGRTVSLEKLLFKDGFVLQKKANKRPKHV